MQQKRQMTALLGILLPLALCAQSKHNFSVAGTIKDGKSGETLNGATIGLLERPGLGVITNAYGFYSITIPEGRYSMVISFSGYTTDTIIFDLKENLVLNRSLSAGNNQLEQVVVSGRRGNNILKAPPGVQRLAIEDIKDIPVLLGEKDVLKTIQMLPGIKPAGDGKSGFYVRGGGIDQNLILLDEATVYNPSHLLGFFSVFNSDALKDISVYKGGMPASYGGRLASVEDIKMKDGNDQQLSGSGGIGLIASRFNLEGPIVKGKGSFIVSARRSYLDLFTPLASDTNVKHSKLYFYDVNMKANYRLDEKNRIFLSGYFGKDVLSMRYKGGVDWGNQTATLRWNHIFNDKLFSNTSLIFSNYNYNVQITNINSTVYVTSGITDYHFKQDFNYYLNPKSKLDFGLDITYHITQPGQAVSSNTSKFNNITLEKKHAMENAVYVSHEWSPGTKVKLIYGMRLTELAVLGPGNAYTYDKEGNIVTRTWYSDGKTIVTYWNPEPRFAATYQLDNVSSVKIAFDRNVQNIHLLNNSTTGSPTNVYLPTSNIVKPEISDQVSAGYYSYFHHRMYEFSSEIYYKTMQNQIDYKNGVNLVGNNNVEAGLLFGKGRGYGWENYIRKTSGKLTGWIGYTLSRTERQIGSINNGGWYPASQDQTHSLSVVGIYKYSRKWTFSADLVYSTGSPTTWPSAKYPVDGAPVYYYTARNGYRLPAYQRLDLGATLLLKKTAKFESDLNFSIYNAYGYANPYTIQFQQDPNNHLLTQVQQTTLFKMVPSITYNFKF
ncbi:MAG: TonB-dependent receptor [Chitinophagaceae bacterium]|nr:TonB-dependent receptor [Chitinophagaceae bacterium]